MNEFVRSSPLGSWNWYLQPLDILEEKPKYQGLNWSGSHPTETLYNALKFQEKGSNLLAVLLIVWRWKGRKSTSPWNTITINCFLFILFIMKIGKLPTLQEHCNLVDVGCKSPFSSATLHFYMNQLMENIKYCIAVLTPDCSEATKSNLYIGRIQSSLKWALKLSWSYAGSWSWVPKVGFNHLGAVSHLSDSVCHCCIQGFLALRSPWDTWKWEFPGSGRAIPISRGGWMSFCSVLLWGRWSSTCRTNQWGTPCAPLEKCISPFLAWDRRGEVNWDFLLSLCGKTACWMPAVITSYRTTLPFPFFFLRLGEGGIGRGWGHLLPLNNAAMSHSLFLTLFIVPESLVRGQDLTTAGIIFQATCPWLGVVIGSNDKL